MEIVLTGLENPRGVAVAITGELYIVEAGTGLYSLDPTKWDGKLTKFTDINGDGDFEDEAEVERWQHELNKRYNKPIDAEDAVEKFSEREDYDRD